MRMQVRGTVKTGQQTIDTGIDDLIVVTGTGGPKLVSASGPEGAVISYSLSNNVLPQIQDQSTYVANRASGTGISLVEYTGGPGTKILLGGIKANAVLSYSLNSGADLATQSNVTGSSDPLMVAADNGRVAMADPAGNGFTVYSLGSGSSLTSPHSVSDTSQSHARKIGAMVTASVGGTDVLLVTSRSEHGISSYTLNSATPSHVDSVGPDDGIGIMVPTAVETVTADGKTFVVLASAPSSGASGGLTVMQLDSSGTLSPTDHILDIRSSRFGKVQDVATITIDDRAYVVAGGNDGGLSLFELTPEGQLIHLDTIVGTNAHKLRNIDAIELAYVGTELQIFVADQKTTGITVLKVELADLGDSRIASQGGSAVSGTSDDDLLTGRDGNDTLSGGNGDDILVDGGGTDRMIGGNGDDLYVLSNDNRPDRIDGFNASDDTLDLSGWAFLYDVNALTITSTSNGAKITFRDEELTLNSASGNALAPADVRAAVSIAINRSFLAPQQTVQGTSGSDMLEGSWGTDTLTGGNGDDTLRGGKGDDRYIGGTGEDTAVIGVSKNAFRVVGVNLAEGRVTIESADGRDVLSTIEYVEFNNGTLDFDAMLAAGGGSNPGETFIGSNGANALFGTGGDDRFFGRAGSDALTGNSGADAMDGGSGSDTIMGEGGADSLEGRGGNDSLLGGAGDDTLTGGMGNDTVDGGTGTDTARTGVLSSSFAVLNYNMSKKTITIGGEKGIDRYSGIEKFQFKNTTLNFAETVARGEKAGKTVKGSPKSDRLKGGDGDDFIFGRGSNDKITGGYGEDVILGDGGNDTIRGQNGNDTINGSTGHDRIYGDRGADRLFASDGHDEVHGNTGQDTVLGGRGNDTLYGEGGRDQLRAESGDDRLYGGTGNDQLRGGDGKDRLYGGNDNDRLHGDGGDDRLFGSFGDDKLYGNARRDELSGGKGQDQLYGGDGADKLVGERGNDTLSGGRGNDTLNGGQGQDRFVFNSKNGDDVVRGFSAQSSKEKLDLRGINSLKKFADLKGSGGAATQKGADVLIDTGDGHSIRLVDVKLSHLDASDFIF